MSPVMNPAMTPVMTRVMPRGSAPVAGRETSLARRVARAVASGPVVALALCLASGVGCSQLEGGSGPAETPNAMLVAQGEQVFLQYCAPCHGADATGHGPAAAALIKRPADLTRLAERRGGEFPAADVAAYIDGRFEVTAHGTREMPIWGVRLREELPEGGLSEEIVRGQITMLVDYLKTIQRPAP
jgi:mono/diheme cytochrome c family protein